LFGEAVHLPRTGNDGDFTSQETLGVVARQVVLNSVQTISSRHGLVLVCKRRKSEEERENEKIEGQRYFYWGMCAILCVSRIDGSGKPNPAPPTF
jgi:hypothetical protein